MKTLNLSVTEFALPSPRLGHIEAFSGFGGLPNVGQALHLQIQLVRTEENPNYVPERWISQTFEREGHRIIVGGRVDGFAPGSPARIEEIKTAYRPEDLRRALFARPDHPYLLQLRSYGYFHSLVASVPPTLTLHLVNARTRQGEDLEIDLDIEGYEDWLERRLRELIGEQKLFDARIARRKKLGPKLPFPFAEPRPGQRELVQTVGERCAKGKTRTLVQAPTGLGKTLGILHPTLQESFARGQKTLYLTAKNSQFAAAEDAVGRMNDSGAGIKSVTLHAKTKMCLKEEPFCNPEYCEYARDHYTKLVERDVLTQLRKKKKLTREGLKKLGRVNEVCPFELQFEAAALADVVIGDYNYVFSPRGQPGRSSHNGWRAQKSLANLVVDEAHNLPARATEYFSASLSCDSLAELASRVPDAFSLSAFRVVDALKEFILELGNQTRPSEPREVRLDPELLGGLQSRAMELQARYLESDAELKTQDPVLRLTNEVGDFVLGLAAARDNFFVTLSPSNEGGILRLTCCDASAHLREVYANFANVVGFSATLKPFDYYARLLGLDGEALDTVEFASPFPDRNRKLLVIPQISTRARDRERNAPKIKESIERLVRLKPGNYFVFFPSFAFLERVLSLVDLPEFTVKAQRRDMRAGEIEDYLESLKQGTPTVIFAVQGGVFAEGVDYPGTMLIGALIVGPALPSFDFERELLRRHFDKRFGQGFDYAYTYPAMARVVQSAGRVIRSATDRGLIVLMDRRFLEEGYRKSMPREWADDTRAVSTGILADVREFWESGET